ncbi:MAG TPA: hypothetical protein VGA56_06785 [Opitutaceae bacterium]
MVETHGGTIDVRSEAGRGTTFTVKIPRLTQDLSLMGEECL